MRKPFTGKHMLAVMVVGFGIVIGINFYMASLATSGFGGVVVENSYVASQKYNGWLEEARREKALGWAATVTRDSAGRLQVQTTDVPEGAKVMATLRRPLGRPEDTNVDLHEVGPQRYASTAVPDGRWIVRLHVTSNGQEWAQESHI